MPIAEVRKALSKTVNDDALVGHFLTVWPVIESILEAFSKATRVPIFGYLNLEKVFQSSIATMPSFCAAMLDSPEMAKHCVADGKRRAKGEEPYINDGVQLCHAGMVNGRREIDTDCVGTLIILFGSKKSTVPEASRRRRAVVQIARLVDEALSTRLEEADLADSTGDIESSDSQLLDVISDIIQRLVSATVGFRSLSINMAHELTLMMVGMGLHTKVMEVLMNRFKDSTDVSVMGELVRTHSHIYTESRLGLYVVRNFLSHASETRYQEVVRPQFSRLDLGNVLTDMVELHYLQAQAKDIGFELVGVEDLPTINGQEMEIRRLFYNVLNNAIKYSYHSVAEARRRIRIKTKDPYEPERYFAISFENYGLGLTSEEEANVFKPGFRGQQAVAEVPNGAGIGLSEATKIMRVHRGRIKFRSQELHGDKGGGRTYLTVVELIFPYLRKRIS